MCEMNCCAAPFFPHSLLNKNKFAIEFSFDTCTLTSERSYNKYESKLTVFSDGSFFPSNQIFVDNHKR